MKKLVLVLLFGQLCFGQNQKPDYLLYDWDSLIEVFVNDGYSLVVYHSLWDNEIEVDSEFLDVVSLEDILDELYLYPEHVLPLNELSSTSFEALHRKTFALDVDDEDVYFDFHKKGRYTVDFYWEGEFEEHYSIKSQTIKVAGIEFFILKNEYFPEDSLGFICIQNDSFLILYDDVIKRSLGQDESPISTYHSAIVSEYHPID